MRGEGARTYYSIDWERFDGDLKGFLGHVERLRSSPPDPGRTESACATAVAKPARRNAS